MKNRVVFTNGCFDILHAGHVDFLQKARRLGDSLIVAVNSDESIRALGKGQNRPINPLHHRMAVLRQLRCVDKVVAFNEPTPLQAILMHRPDVLVKGGDYRHADIVGAAEVESWGGMVVTIPFSVQASTTAIVERIRAAA